MLTYNGAAFAIKFENEEAVANLLDIYNDLEMTKKFQNEFEEKYQRLKDQIGETATESELMDTLFDILGDFNLNIDLYKASTDGQNFITVWNKIDQETLNPEPCN